MLIVYKSPQLKNAYSIHIFQCNDCNTSKRCYLFFSTIGGTKIVLFPRPNGRNWSKFHRLYSRYKKHQTFRSQSEKLPHAIYDSKWYHNLGSNRSQCKNVAIILNQTQKTVVLTAGGIIPMNMRCYTKVQMRRSSSMLAQIVLLCVLYLRWSMLLFRTTVLWKLWALSSKVVLFVYLNTPLN